MCGAPCVSCAPAPFGGLRVPFDLFNKTITCATKLLRQSTCISSPWSSDRTRLMKPYGRACRYPSLLISGSSQHSSLYGLELTGRNPRVVALQHAALRFLERGRRGAAMLVPMGCAVELAAAAAAAQLGGGKRQAARARGTLQLLAPFGRIGPVGRIRRGVGPAPLPLGPPCAPCMANVRRVRGCAR